MLAGCHAQQKENLPANSQDKAEADMNVMPEHIEARDTSLGWLQPGEKMLVTGTVYDQDGRTPVAGVVVYYYHTNIHGRYVHIPGEKRSMPPNSKGQTHGHIRGWVKTDSNGRYSIYTVRPGAYPGRDEPAHIHLTIYEPTQKAYYIDDVVFDDDRLLTTARRTRMENRAGSGVARCVRKGGLTIAERNIILGLNIPGYPKKKNDEVNSGRSIGEDVISFTPFHAWGPDKGSKTCPVCKYSWYHGILYFVGNHPNWNEIKQWLAFLEKESIKREKYLKVYFIYGNENGYDRSVREKELQRLGETLQLKKTALTIVPSFSDKESGVHFNRVNPETENTFLIYKRSNVIGKYINIKPTAENFSLVQKRLDQTINEYFNLPTGDGE